MPRTLKPNPLITNPIKRPVRIQFPLGRYLLVTNFSWFFATRQETGSFSECESPSEFIWDTSHTLKVHNRDYSFITDFGSEVWNIDKGSFTNVYKEDLVSSTAGQGEFRDDLAPETWGQQGKNPNTGESTEAAKGIFGFNPGNPIDSSDFPQAFLDEMKQSWYTSEFYDLATRVPFEYRAPQIKSKSCFGETGDIFKRQRFKVAEKATQVLSYTFSPKGHRVTLALGGGKDEVTFEPIMVAEEAGALFPLTVRDNQNSDVNSGTPVGMTLVWADVDREYDAIQALRQNP